MEVALVVVGILTGISAMLIVILEFVVLRMLYRMQANRVVNMDNSASSPTLTVTREIQTEPDMAFPMRLPLHQRPEFNQYFGNILPAEEFYENISYDGIYYDNDEDNLY